MTRIVRLAALLACTAPARALLAMQEHAADAHAADAHTAHEVVGAIPTVQQGLVTGITALLIFFVVFFVLQAKVWPVITKALDERADKIKNEIQAAERARQQAADALASYQKNLAEARAEAQKMLEETRGQQQKLAADLKAKAEVELNALREKAKRDIEAAKRAAMNEVYAESAALASSLASKILQREIRPADHQRLVDESLAQLQTSAS